MKKALLALAAASALVLAVVLPLNNSARASGAPASAALPQERGERHPAIRQAIHHLEMAKESLEKAEHGFGGHRARAIEHVNQALEECHKALEFDRR
jgi:hypothetical protein